MNIIKNSIGFTLIADTIAFDFETTVCPIFEKNTATAEICGKVPIPKLLPGDRLLLPADEGIAITVDKEYESGEFDCNLIEGDFCSREGTMSMIIIERGGKYLLINLEIGINSEYKAERKDGFYGLEILCRKPCKTTYSIFDSLAAACKFHRSLSKDNFITLKEKALKNPEIEKLIGGAIFWVWSNNYDEVMYSENDTSVSPAVGKDLLDIASELNDSGVDNALFGLFFNDDSHMAEILYNKYGYICTQYDNYNDIFNPAMSDIVPKNRIRNCDYTYRRMKDYPNGVRITESGEFAPAWALKGFDGKMHNQNTCCPLTAMNRMKEEIPQILNEYPYYKGRFIDVYGGGLSECYSPTHPLTLEACLDTQKEAFRAIEEDMGLIAGTEDGFENIINTLTYTEGLHSPIYFRIHDAGRNHAHCYNSEQTKHIKKHMTNPECRIPLWHLTYHECLLAFPYWGDSTESSPELLRKKTLFACLYGCPPLYSFNVKDFKMLKDGITDSYKKITSVHKKVAFLPMTDFKILSDDYSLQQSVFGNRYRITVNFSDTECAYNEKIIKGNDFITEEI